jgi:competence protein ComEC
MVFPNILTVFWRGWTAENDRWPLWLPVALGTGCALYFALPVEPDLVWGWTALGLGLALVLAATAWLPGRIVLALLAALLLGLGLARLRAETVATPVLDKAITAHVTGRIVFIEKRPRGVRYVLDHVRSGAFGDTLPLRVRIAQRAGGADLKPGDWVSLFARLDAPPPPVEPGAADFGRSQYFQSIGAVGFAYGRARGIVPAMAPGRWERVTLAVEALRGEMTRRIQAGLPGSMGAIAASLVTGTRGGIAEEDEAALRDAGLAHVLAISGLQMAMVGGGIFWLLRAMLAVIPALVLRYPVKKWAAVAALAGTAFYLVISGAAPSASRAFVMFGFMMLAVLVDRPALSMRVLALAAGVLLLAQPENVADPGFQMSFAAVAGLVAVAEWEQGRARREPRGFLWRYVRGVAMTALVGSIATLPFSLFHFERAAHYAVLGNLIAMPLVGLWVMPAAALAVLLMPFGLEGWALSLLGQGLEMMVAMGRWVSGLPGAVSLLPSLPLAALAAVTLGGLWLVIWQGRKRWLGLAAVLPGIVLAVTARPADMLVGRDGVTVAVRGADGLLHFPHPPPDRFTARAWLRRDGDGRELEQATGMAEARCDGLGCVVRRNGLVIALARRPDGLDEDCRRAQVLVSAVAAHCPQAAVMIDSRAASAGQGWRVRLSSPPHAESVRAWRGHRPWVAAPSSAE